MTSKHHFRSSIFIFLLAVLFVGSAIPIAVDANQARANASFWIGDTGPTGPIFTGPHQFPFICFSFERGLGQPLVDNQVGIGNAVFPEPGGSPDFTADPVGYSRNCSIRTRVDYFYFSQSMDNFLPLMDPASVPADAATLTVDGKRVNFVVRLERGTINRFIYSIAMLAPFAESLANPRTLNNDAWNGKLVYKFQGGVGIGHWQGSFSLSKSQALHLDSLKRGYAVAYSTGTKTGTQYNLRLAEETALMVKQHFVATYGKPKYTVGIGGSGGGIQQYVIGQNNRHIIDAGIPQLSYPDMISQTTNIGDCELLERYFDMEYVADNTSRWGDWLERIKVEGMVANTFALKEPWSLSPFAPVPGSSECIAGWRGSTQLVLNPHWTDQGFIDALKLYRYPQEVIDNIKWSHWNDLGNIYPQDENGFASNSWDNVGVQYGLRSLARGGITDITEEEFLDLNACVGGWKQPQEMTLGNYPWNRDADPASFDPWDQANMNLSPDDCKTGTPAPRTEGDIATMNAAYDSGHVFTGKLPIPLIGVRWYLEPVLDMHHTQASFASRARMIARMGHADNQVLWIAECSELDPINLRDNCAHDPTGDALDVMDQWMDNIKGATKGSSLQHIIKSKPAAAVDSCFFGDGTLLYAGPDAWDGVIDNKSPGPCTTAFPVFSTSRIESGGNPADDVFKCALKPVTTALADGTYGSAVFSDLQRARLHAIFTTGVCDYSQPDVGKPGEDDDEEDDEGDDEEDEDD